MKLWYVLPLALCASIPAFGQPMPDGPANNNSNWTQSFEFDISPTFGKSLRKGNDGKSDISDYTAFYTLKKKNAIYNASLAINIGATYDPDAIGMDDESSTYGEIVIGDDPFSVKPFRFNPTDAENVTSQLTPTLAFRYAKVDTGFFDKRTRNEKTLTAGITYKDVWSLACEKYRKILGNALRCNEKPKVSIKTTLQIERIWSNDPGEGRVSPIVKVVAQSPALRKSFFAFARMKTEVRFYEARVPLTNRQRIDRKLSFTLGVDLAPWLSRYSNVIDTFEIGAMYSGRRSSDKTKDFDRGYFAPSLTLIKTF